MPSSLPHLPSPVKSPVDEIASGSGLSPLERLPFFGKYKNNMSDLSTSPDSFLESDRPIIGSQSSPDHARDEKPRLRNLSVSTVTSRTYRRGAAFHHDSDSDSECGLAYADSSGDETEGGAKFQGGSDKKPSSIFRSDSTATTRRVHFSGDRNATIVQALGISPTNREASDRQAFGHQRHGTASSIDTRSIYSRTTSIGPFSSPVGLAGLGHTMETLEEEAVIGELPELPSHRQSKGESARNPRDESGLGPGFQPHRSNTVQVPPHSPENKPPKLPTRAKTTNEHNKFSLEPPAARKEKPRRTRVCLRCEMRIEDGRWIKVDAGGALCEKCWKNMYLPKVC
jgi:hypothetical protein